MFQWRACFSDVGGGASFVSGGGVHPMGASVLMGGF